jgi:16S rRNA (cytidine1402-2'-O)-methyltransferase
MPTKKDSVTGQKLPMYSTHPGQRGRISMIAVPIGNLSDMTPRAIETILACDELWCEDTRHTQALLNALKIEGRRFRRVDQHVDENELGRWLDRVEEEGQRIGVLTDAGTPGISDPGAKVIELVFKRPGIRVEPIAGVSAVSAFVSVAAFQENSFLFRGFFPRETKDQLELLTELKGSAGSRNWIFFESPNRIRETLGALKTWSEGLEFAPHFILAKELTKMHETLYAGDGAQFLEHLLQQHFDERGEWVFSVTIPKDCVKNEKDETSWALTLECLIAAGISTKDAAHVVSERFPIAKNLAYKESLEIQKKMKKNDSSA